MGREKIFATATSPLATYTTYNALMIISTPVILCILLNDHSNRSVHMCPLHVEFVVILLGLGKSTRHNAVFRSQIGILTT
jgi:hypothetical protein